MTLAERTSRVPVLPRRGFLPAEDPARALTIVPELAVSVPARI